MPVITVKYLFVKKNRISDPDPYVFLLGSLSYLSISYVKCIMHSPIQIKSSLHPNPISHFFYLPPPFPPCVLLPPPPIPKGLTVNASAMQLRITRARGVIRGRREKSGGGVVNCKCRIRPPPLIITSTPPPPPHDIN